MTAPSPTVLVDGDHVVQFYDEEHDLAEVVTRYLVSAVVDGDTVVVVATQGHRDLFTSGLSRAEIDLEEALRSGSVQIVDATELLGRFIIDGVPDPDAFKRSVGDLILDAGASGRPVRVYGEMVALLWAEGNRDGAIQLERLWNDLADEMSFALFCAYPSSAMRSAQDADGFTHICDLHSTVVAGAPTPIDPHASRRFARSSDGPRLARAFTLDTLRSWALGEVLDDCLLVVSELAANAVRHAGSEFTVSLSRSREVLHVVVGDTSTDVPVVHAADPKDPGGRGLEIVRRISEDWGHVVLDDGKLVWAQIGIPA